MSQCVNMEKLGLKCFNCSEMANFYRHLSQTMVEQNRFPSNLFVASCLHTFNIWYAYTHGSKKKKHLHGILNCTMIVRCQAGQSPLGH